MRNCEQLLGSLGLFAHRVGSLDSLNEVLSHHGPESSKGFLRVTVKLKPGQQTAVEISTAVCCPDERCYFDVLPRGKTSK